MTAPKQESSDFHFIFIALFLIAALFIFWHFFRVPILEGLRWVRLSELWLVGLFTHEQDACQQWLLNAHVGPADLSPKMMKLTNDCFGSANIAALPSAARYDYYSLTGYSMGEIEKRAAQYIRWPLVAAFISVGIYVFYFSPRNKFRTTHTIESFIRMQAKMWPVINPIVDFNPIKSSARIPGDTMPDKLPLFAEAMSPEEWLSWHRIPVTNGIVDREATRRALIMQLGPRWTGIEGQAPYIQALFAAFALKGGQKREESDEFLGKIALCWNHKTGFRISPEVAAETKKILADPKLGGAASNEAAKYAYRGTALLGTLRWARAMGGVLAPAQFLWLRGMDRTLWYTLNNLGRRSYHSEGAGAIAHYMAEIAAKKPLPIPRVDTAIVTLNQFLADPNKRPLPIPPREGDKPREVS